MPISMRNIQKIDDGYIINIYKPEGWTSFDVVKKIKKVTGLKKVGHAGTLDPFASGVLLVCLGKATKKIKEFMDLPKEYEAILRLGKTTTTLDKTGKIIEEKPIKTFSKDQVVSILNSFLGSSQQKVPAYSAAKIGGRRFYRLARQGKEVPERFRNIQIYELSLLDYQPDKLNFKVRCSRGTYIRTLGLDIAHKMESTGYLEGLVRTSIGPYRVNDSLSIEEFSTVWSKINKNESILFHS